MRFNILGIDFEVSDKLIEEYIRRTPVSNDTLIPKIRNHLKCVLSDRKAFAPDLNKAIEESIRDELELWK